MPRAKEITLKVANTEFTIGDTLEITPKLDLDAPDGFQKHGTSKLLMKGIAEPFSINFDEDLQMWDTGFDQIHPINSKIPSASKDAVVKGYITNIKQPFEKRFNKDLSSTEDNTFWPEYIVDVYKGRKLDTSNIKDLLDLYLILKNGMACNEKEKDYFLKKARYNIKNTKQVKNVEEKRQETKFDAIGLLKVMLDSFDAKKDDTIYTILEWINVPNLRGADKDTVKRVVVKQLDNEKTGYDMARRFLDAYEMTKSKSDKVIMENFSVLNKLLQKRKIQYKRQQYFIGDILIGNNLKEGAQKLLSDEELIDIVDKEYQKIK